MKYFMRLFLSALLLTPRPLWADSSMMFEQTINYLDCGSPALLNDMNKYTAMVWTQFATAAGIGILLSKESNGTQNVFPIRRAVGALEFQVAQDQTGTDLSYITNNSAISLGTNYFVAATYTDEITANRVHIYLGSATSMATERTYGTATSGTGTKVPDSTRPLIVGNNNSFANSAGGKIFAVHIVSGVLNLAQIQDQQFSPHVTTGTLALWFLDKSTPTIMDMAGKVPACSIRGSSGNPTAFPFTFPGGPL